MCFEAVGASTGHVDHVPASTKTRCRTRHILTSPRGSSDASLHCAKMERSSTLGESALRVASCVNPSNPVVFVRFADAGSRSASEPREIFRVPAQRRPCDPIRQPTLYRAAGVRSVPAFAAASSSKPAGVAGKCRDGAILETSSRQHRFTPVVVHPCRLVGFGIRTKTPDYKCAADYEQKIERRGDRPACIQGSLTPGSLDDVAAVDPTPYRRRPVRSAAVNVVPLPKIGVEHMSPRVEAGKGSRRRPSLPIHRGVEPR